VFWQGMTPDLPQVQCTTAESGASGRTGQPAQNQRLLFHCTAAVLPDAIPSVPGSEATAALVSQTTRFLKTGF